MTMESLISLQSSGIRSIGEPTAPRPAGVHRSSVLVVLDVNKGVNPAVVYWALANIVRKDDTVKILGIITHIPNAMGFMTRVDQSIRNNPNIMEMQFEIATKKEAIWRTSHVHEWCRRAGVKLDVDVKAGNNPKVIATDEAKSIGAYHVVLDKNMKKDRKYFIDNLTCFVSRIRSSGGVDTIRSYAVSSKLPPMTPKGASTGSSQPLGHHSRASVGSNASSIGHRGASSMSSTSFELGGESSDEFSAQEGDPLSAPSTGEPLDRPVSPEPELNIRTDLEQMRLQQAPAAAAAAAAPGKPSPNLYHLLRGPVLDASGESFYNVNVNPLRKSASDRIILPDFDNQGPLVTRTALNVNPFRKPAPDRISLADFDKQGPLTPRSTLNVNPFGKPAADRISLSDFNNQYPLTPRNSQRVHHGQQQQQAGGMVNGWIGQLNVAPEMGRSKMGRQSLAVTLQTQASFNGGRKQTHRQDKLSMDMHWPLMDWADCRGASKLQSGSTAQNPNGVPLHMTSHASINNFRGGVRRSRIPVSSGLNYGDMIDSD